MVVASRSSMPGARACELRVRGVCGRGPTCASEGPQAAAARHAEPRIGAKHSRRDAALTPPHAHTAAAAGVGAICGVRRVVQNDFESCTRCSWV